ncbi:hypothetical protein FQR65_LT05150 [Abscondita terminalis]|nr:hypothetical protein FQR65_LT05150 [Abscondita terminalis]
MATAAREPLYNHYLSKALINRTEANVKNSYGLDKPVTLDNFISQYEALTFGQFENFSQEFFIRNVNSDTPIQHSEDINNLLDRQDESEISALLNRIAPPADNSARDDSIIYFLSACLRKDAASFVDSNLGSLITLNPDLDKLDNYLEIESIISYLKHYNLQLVLHKFNEAEADRNVTVYAVSEPEFSLDIIGQGEHFDVLLDEELAKKIQIQEDEELVKKIQIQEDEELAKALQIEEIELFVLENKTSNNKNSLSLMHSFIENLGLKEELTSTSKEFSTASYFFKNSNIIEQLIEMFKLAIINLGYSSHFKDKIKEQTPNYFPAFFSTCRQARVNTDQTLSFQAPTIRCN